jgi:HEAT repeat protein
MERRSLTAKLAAAEALGRIGDPRAVEPLVASLGDLGELRGPDGCDLRLRRNVAKALGDIGKVAAIPALCVLRGDRFTAGAAIESLGKVLRWDAANAGADDLHTLAEIDDVQQAPWMIDEAREAASGDVMVREGRAWSVDSADLRAQALAELRRRENDR